LGAYGQGIAGGTGQHGIYVGSNNYYNVSWKYSTTGLATQFKQNESNSGAFVWSIAPTGLVGGAITWTSAMTLDASGNLGVKCTPSTWSAGTAFEVGAGYGLSLGYGSGMYLAANAYYNSGWKYAATTVATAIQSAAGQHNFLVAASGTAGTAISWTNALVLDNTGNAQLQSGAVMPYAPAPAAISAAATLTNANIQGQIISATGTTYTITMPLGTTLETLVTAWAAVNVAYDFFVINTASGTVTMAVNTGVTSLGALTIAAATSAHFRIRRTAANTFVLYRLV
jgi:hypothetical protein